MPDVEHHFYWAVIWTLCISGAIVYYMILRPRNINRGYHRAARHARWELERDAADQPPKVGNEYGIILIDASHRMTTVANQSWCTRCGSSVKKNPIFLGRTCRQQKWPGSYDLKNNQLIKNWEH